MRSDETLTLEHVTRLLAMFVRSVGDSLAALAATVEADDAELAERIQGLADEAQSLVRTLRSEEEDR